MTDILAVFFLIGLGALFTILLFIFKQSILAIASGLSWGLLGVYNFTRYYSGDPDAGNMVYSFAWFCVALAIVFFSSPFWLLKKTGIDQDANSDTREDWEIDDERREKRMKYLRRNRVRYKNIYKP